MNKDTSCDHYLGTAGMNSVCHNPCAGCCLPLHLHHSPTFSGQALQIPLQTPVEQIKVVAPTTEATPTARGSAGSPPVLFSSWKNQTFSGSPLAWGRQYSLIQSVFHSGAKIASALPLCSRILSNSVLFPNNYWLFLLWGWVEPEWPWWCHHTLGLLSQHDISGTWDKVLLFIVIPALGLKSELFSALAQRAAEKAKGSKCQGGW